MKNNQTNIDNDDLYLIFINSPKLNPSEKNKIHTSQFQWNNFFPKLLMVQFSRLANIYFLIIAILQSIRDLSYSDGLPLILFPLSFVITLNGIKDLYEDFKRKKSDTEENNKITLVYNKEKNDFIEKKWKDIKLGEIVKINNDEPFPADLLLLNSSDQKGICYIETKNIDGETNLKYRQVNNDIKNIIKSKDDLLNFNYVCITKQPNEFIYEFSATLYEYNDKGLKNKEKFILIDEKSFLLRGSTLKQTEFILGCVIYVGENTKSNLNSPNVRSKHSNLEYLMNIQIVTIFCFQLFIASCASILHIIYYYNLKDKLQYLFSKKEQEITILKLFFKSSGTWVIVFTNFVPISLLVTMETIKFLQGLFISWDIEMFDIERDFGTKVHTSTINEELGQVKFIFSDKTGTLTKNYMQFKCMSINDKIYGNMEKSNIKNNKIKDKYGFIKNVNFYDINNEFNNDLNNNLEIIHHFMICLCLCNSIIIDHKKFENEKIIKYQSSSPDEKALVNFARSQGYIFLDRTNKNEIILEIKGIKKIYKILNELEYTSERMRMSIICKDEESNKIFLYSKGADSIIESLLHKKHINSNILIKTKEYLNKFSIKGLRTFLISYKEIPLLEYEKWNEEYIKIKKNIKKDILNKEILEKKIESNLNLLGSTAIEDELQDDVDLVINSLLSTGIKIWMLTGDKLETAKNIAFSCKLFDSNMKIITFNNNIPLQNQLNDIIKNPKFKNKKIKYSLLLSSEILTKIFQNFNLLKQFYKISNRCISVVISRISPKQKAEIVNLIKTSNNAITLAIGDGSNDVGMINEANIGIGIYGKEGTEASRASDYVITQFSFLRKLLLFHGREFYRKNSYVVIYNFYKNVLFVFPMFFMGFLNIFSGMTIYDPYIHQFYNTFYTALPIVWFGVFDLEFNQFFLVNNSKFYIQGIYKLLFNTKIFWINIFIGIFQSFIHFFVMNFTFKNFNSKGFSYDYWIMGEFIYCVIINVANLKILIDSNNHSYFSVFFIFGSIILYYLTILIFSYLEKFETFKYYNFMVTGHWSNVIFDLKFVMSLFICVIFSLCFDVFIKKFLIKFGFIIQGDKLSPYIDNTVFNDKENNNINEEDNDNTYYELLL